MLFIDRADAGRRLAAALETYRDRQATVLALPRGGVIVAAEVVRQLHAAFDLLLVRKIGVPWQPEVAMGAVAEGAEPTIIRNADIIAAAQISEPQFQQAYEHELAVIARRQAHYLGARPRAAVTGRIVIMVDDGIATGATTRAALRAVRRQHPQALILAVPVAPAATLAQLRPEADAIICLEEARHFTAVGNFYRNFREITDTEVIDLLAQLAPLPA